MAIAYIFSQAVLIEQILICFDHRQKKKKKKSNFHYPWDVRLCWIKHSKPFLLIKVWIFLKARNPETGMCLDTMARSIGSELGVSPCHGMGGNQVCNVHKRTQTALPTT